jgi:hypothetical protein
MRRFALATFTLACVLTCKLLVAEPAGGPLPGTAPLETQGDLAEQMVAGIDRFLLREIDASVDKRARHWKRDFSSREAYDKSVAPNRARLAKIIGAHEVRTECDDLELKL